MDNFHILKEQRLDCNMDPLCKIMLQKAKFMLENVVVQDRSPGTLTTWPWRQLVCLVVLAVCIRVCRVLHMSMSVQWRNGGHITCDTEIHLYITAQWTTTRRVPTYVVLTGIVRST